ncbi:hypothetical protein BGX20_000657, partial [Mortierella sp. AD010]
MGGSSEQKLHLRQFSKKCVRLSEPQGVAEKFFSQSPQEDTAAVEKETKSNSGFVSPESSNAAPATVLEDEVRIEERPAVEEKITPETEDHDRNKATELRLKNKGMIADIDTYLEGNRGKNIPHDEESNKPHAVQQYLHRRNAGMKMHAAAQGAPFDLAKTLSYSRRILDWANQREADRTIVLSRRGKHSKTRSLLTESNIYSNIKFWICDNHKYNITPFTLQKRVSEVVIPDIGTQKIN